MPALFYLLLEKNIKLSELVGSGKDGRILKDILKSKGKLHHLFLKKLILYYPYQIQKAGLV
jgi:hypothetical protein